MSRSHPLFSVVRLDDAGLEAELEALSEEDWGHLLRYFQRYCAVVGDVGRPRRKDDGDWTRLGILQREVHNARVLCVRPESQYLPQRLVPLSRIPFDARAQYGAGVDIFEQVIEPLLGSVVQVTIVDPYLYAAAQRTGLLELARACSRNRELRLVGIGTRAGEGDPEATAKEIRSGCRELNFDLLVNRRANVWHDRFLVLVLADDVKYPATIGRGVRSFKSNDPTVVALLPRETTTQLDALRSGAQLVR